jgi:hypothetical protein
MYDMKSSRHFNLVDFTRLISALSCSLSVLSTTSYTIYNMQQDEAYTGGIGSRLGLRLRLSFHHYVCSGPEVEVSG